MVLVILLIWYLQRHKPRLVYLPVQEVMLNAGLDSVLMPEDFATLQKQVKQLPATRTSLFGWRQSAVTDATSIMHHAPFCLDIYNSLSLRQKVQVATGVRDRLDPLPLSMPLSCCLLRYDKAGDHITWHYDNNYHKGKTFTVLLTVFNRNAAGQCCSGNQSCRMIDGTEVCQDTRENSLVVLDGSNTLHSTKKLQEGEVRLVLSMVFCTDSRQTPWQAFCTSVKNISFFHTA